MRIPLLIAMAVTAAASLASGSAGAQAPARDAMPEPVLVPGIYSSLAPGPAGGLQGMELYVVPDGRGGFLATVQCADGALGPPRFVPVGGQELSIQFTLPTADRGCGRKFTGVLSQTGLRGRFAGEQADRWLPRKQSFWQ